MQSRVKCSDAHAVGVGFYSNMIAMVFADTSEYVDEVIESTFSFYAFSRYGTNNYNNNQ